jgi:hypothetical protein
MNPYKYSSVARALDPTYPTNRAVLILMPILFAAGAALAWLQGEAVLGGLLFGARLALAAFIAWALTREIDPDHELSAFLSLVLGTAAVIILPEANLLVAFWLMAVLRILNRTTGLPARWLDTLAVAGFSSWMLWTFDWTLGVIAGLAFILDGVLSEPLLRHRYVGLGLILLSILRVLVGPTAAAPHILSTDLIWELVAVVIFLPLLIRSSTMKSICDATGERINPRRVQSGQIVTFAAAGILLSRDPSGLEAASLIIASILGAGLFYLGSWPGSRQNADARARE